MQFVKFSRRYAFNNYEDIFVNKEHVRYFYIADAKEQTVALVMNNGTEIVVAGAIFNIAENLNSSHSV